MPIADLTTGSRTSDVFRTVGGLDLNLGPLDRLRSGQVAIANTAPLMNIEPATYPRIILKDSLGYELDTYTTLQEAIYRAKWNVRSTGQARTPLEWRLPKAPPPARPDFTRTCPPLKHPRLYQGYGKQYGGYTNVLEIDVDDVSFVKESLDHLPFAPSLSFLRQEILMGPKTYFQIVGTMLLHKKLLSETEKRQAIYNFPGFCTGCVRMGLCYGCERGSEPHYHEDKLVKTGGGFTYYKKDRPEKEMKHKHPLNWRINHPDHVLKKLMEDYAGVHLEGEVTEKVKEHLDENDTERDRPLTDGDLMDSDRLHGQYNRGADGRFLPEIDPRYMTEQQRDPSGLGQLGGPGGRGEGQGHGRGHSDDRSIDPSEVEIELWEDGRRKPYSKTSGHVHLDPNGDRSFGGRSSLSAADPNYLNSRGDQRSRDDSGSRQYESDRYEHRLPKYRKTDSDDEMDDEDLKRDYEGDDESRGRRKERLYKPPAPFKLKKSPKRRVEAKSPFSTDRSYDIQKGRDFVPKKSGKKPTEFVDFRNVDVSWKEPKKFELKKGSHKPTKFWSGQKNKKKEKSRSRSPRVRRAPSPRSVSPDSGLDTGFMTAIVRAKSPSKPTKDSTNKKRGKKGTPCLTLKMRDKSPHHRGYRNPLDEHNDTAAEFYKLTTELSDEETTTNTEFVTNYPGFLKAVAKHQPRAVYEPRSDAISPIIYQGEKRPADEKDFSTNRELERMAHNIKDRKWRHARQDATLEEERPPESDTENSRRNTRYENRLESGSSASSARELRRGFPKISTPTSERSPRSYQHRSRCRLRRPTSGDTSTHKRRFRSPVELPHISNARNLELERSTANDTMMSQKAHRNDPNHDELFPFRSKSITRFPNISTKKSEDKHFPFKRNYPRHRLKSPDIEDVRNKMPVKTMKNNSLCNSKAENSPLALQALTRPPCEITDSNSDQSDFRREEERTEQDPKEYNMSVAIKYLNEHDNDKPHRVRKTIDCQRDKDANSPRERVFESKWFKERGESQNGSQASVKVQQSKSGSLDPNRYIQKCTTARIHDMLRRRTNLPAIRKLGGPQRASSPTLPTEIGTLSDTKYKLLPAVADLHGKHKSDLTKANKESSVFSDPEYVSLSQDDIIRGLSKTPSQTLPKETMSLSNSEYVTLPKFNHTTDTSNTTKQKVTPLNEHTSLPDSEYATFLRKQTQVKPQVTSILSDPEKENLTVNQTTSGFPLKSPNSPNRCGQLQAVKVKRRVSTSRKPIESSDSEYETLMAEKTSHGFPETSTPITTPRETLTIPNNPDGVYIAVKKGTKGKSVRAGSDSHREPLVLSFKGNRNKNARKRLARYHNEADFLNPDASNENINPSDQPFRKTHNHQRAQHRNEIESPNGREATVDIKTSTASDISTRNKNTLDVSSNENVFIDSYVASGDYYEPAIAPIEDLAQSNDEYDKDKNHIYDTSLDIGNMTNETNTSEGNITEQSTKKRMIYHFKEQVDSGVFVSHGESKSSLTDETDVENQTTLISKTIKGNHVSAPKDTDSRLSTIESLPSAGTIEEDARFVQDQEYSKSRSVFKKSNEGKHFTEPNEWKMGKDADQLSHIRSIRNHNQRRENDHIGMPIPYKKEKEIIGSTNEDVHTATQHHEEAFDEIKSSDKLIPDMEHSSLIDTNSISREKPVVNVKVMKRKKMSHLHPKYIKNGSKHITNDTRRNYHYLKQNRNDKESRPISSSDFELLEGNTMESVLETSNDNKRETKMIEQQYNCQIKREHNDMYELGETGVYGDDSQSHLKRNGFDYEEEVAFCHDKYKLDQQNVEKTRQKGVISEHKPFEQFHEDTAKQANTNERCPASFASDKEDSDKNFYYMTQVNQENDNRDVYWNNSDDDTYPDDEDADDEYADDDNDRCNDSFSRRDNDHRQLDMENRKGDTLKGVDRTAMDDKDRVLHSTNASHGEPVQLNETDLQSHVEICDLSKGDKGHFKHLGRRRRASDSLSNEQDSSESDMPSDSHVSFHSNTIGDCLNSEDIYRQISDRSDMSSRNAYKRTNRRTREHQGHGSNRPRQETHDEYGDTESELDPDDRDNWPRLQRQDSDRHNFLQSDDSSGADEYVKMVDSRGFQDEQTIRRYHGELEAEEMDYFANKDYDIESTDDGSEYEGPKEEGSRHRPVISKTEKKIFERVPEDAMHGIANRVSDHIEAREEMHRYNHPIGGNDDANDLNEPTDQRFRNRNASENVADNDNHVESKDGKIRYRKPRDGYIEDGVVGNTGGKRRQRKVFENDTDKDNFVEYKDGKRRYRKPHDGYIEDGVVDNTGWKRRQRRVFENDTDKDNFVEYKDGKRRYRKPHDGYIEDGAVDNTGGKRRYRRVFENDTDKDNFVECNDGGRRHRKHFTNDEYVEAKDGRGRYRKPIEKDAHEDGHVITRDAVPKHRQYLDGNTGEDGYTEVNDGRKKYQKSHARHTKDSKTRSRPDLIKESSYPKSNIGFVARRGRHKYRVQRPRKEADYGDNQQQDDPNEHYTTDDDNQNIIPSGDFDASKNTRKESNKQLQKMQKVIGENGIMLSGHDLHSSKDQSLREKTVSKREKGRGNKDQSKQREGHTIDEYHKYARPKTIVNDLSKKHKDEGKRDRNKQTKAISDKYRQNVLDKNVDESNHIHTHQNLKPDDDRTTGIDNGKLPGSKSSRDGVGQPKEQSELLHPVRKGINVDEIPSADGADKEDSVFEKAYHHYNKEEKPQGRLHPSLSVRSISVDMSTLSPHLHMHGSSTTTESSDEEEHHLSRIKGSQVGSDDEDIHNYRYRHAINGMSPPRINSSIAFDGKSLTSQEPELELVFDDAIDVANLEITDEIDPEYEKLKQREERRKRRHRHRRKKKLESLNQYEVNNCKEIGSVDRKEDTEVSRTTNTNKNDDLNESEENNINSEDDYEEHCPDDEEFFKAVQMIDDETKQFNSPVFKNKYKSSSMPKKGGKVHRRKIGNREREKEKSNGHGVHISKENVGKFKEINKIEKSANKSFDSETSRFGRPHDKEHSEINERYPYKHSKHPSLKHQLKDKSSRTDAEITRNEHAEHSGTDNAPNMKYANTNDEDESDYDDNIDEKNAFDDTYERIPNESTTSLTQGGHKINTLKLHEDDVVNSNLTNCKDEDETKPNTERDPLADKIIEMKKAEVLKRNKKRGRRHKRSFPDFEIDFSSLPSIQSQVSKIMHGYNYDDQANTRRSSSRSSSRRSSRRYSTLPTDMYRSKSEQKRRDSINTPYRKERSLSLPHASDLMSMKECLDTEDEDELREAVAAPVYLGSFPRSIAKKQFKKDRKRVKGRQRSNPDSYVEEDGTNKSELEPLREESQVIEPVEMERVLTPALTRIPTPASTNSLLSNGNLSNTNNNHGNWVTKPLSTVGEGNALRFNEEVSGLSDRSLIQEDKPKTPVKREIVKKEKKVKTPLPVRPKSVTPEPEPEPTPVSPSPEPIEDEEPVSREISFVFNRDLPELPPIEVPELPEVPETERTEYKGIKREKKLIEVTPELPAQKKKFPPPPKRRPQIKMRAPSRKTKVAEAPVTTQELQQMTDPLDFLAKYCIINPDRLPFYERVFNGALSVQTPRYSRATEAPKGAIVHLPPAQLSDHELNMLKDITVLNKGHCPRNDGLSAPEQYVEKLNYSIEFTKSKQDIIQRHMEKVQAEKMAYMASMAKLWDRDIARLDYKTKIKKKKKKKKKKMKDDEPDYDQMGAMDEKTNFQPMKASDITDEVIVSRMDDKMMKKIKKDPAYLKYKVELGRDIEKLKHYDERVAQIEDEKDLVGLYCMDYYFTEQEAMSRPHEFRRQQSRLYQKLHPDTDVEMNIEEVEPALQQINNKLLTEREFQYIYFILDLPKREKINFRLFTIIAALSEKVTQMDPVIRKLINKVDYNALDVKLEKSKELFQLLQDEHVLPQGKAPSDNLAVELTAGGLTPEHTNYVMNKFDREGRGYIDFLDFVTYIPLFIDIHQRIVEDPFNQTLSV